MTDFSPFNVSGSYPLHRDYILRQMLDQLDQGERSTQASASDSESMEIPGEGTPPSVGGKEEKIGVPGGGKKRKGKSPEVEKEKPKPRASVLEYKSVSQMYVLRVSAMYPSEEIGCLRVLQLG